MPVFHCCSSDDLQCACWRAARPRARRQRTRRRDLARATRCRAVQAGASPSPALLVGSIFIADRFGLVTLIASGYRALAYLFLVVYVLPLLTIGVWRLLRVRRRRPWPRNPIPCKEIEHDRTFASRCVLARRC
jgi:hypothetical protein